MCWCLERVGRTYVYQNGKIHIVDTCHTFDAGYETAIESFNEDTIEQALVAWNEDEPHLTKETLADSPDLLEEFAEFIVEVQGEYLWDFCWDVVKNYRSHSQAEKWHDKICADPQRYLH